MLKYVTGYTIKLITSIFISRRQLENPGHYEDLENYYHRYKNCFLRNNYIPSPSYEKVPGLEEIPVLKVFNYCSNKDSI